MTNPMENLTVESNVKQANDGRLGTMNDYIFRSEKTFPRKFTIPALKSKQQSTGSASLGSTSSNISQFLLKHLEEQANSSTRNVNRFNVPVLGSKAASTGFNVPELKNGKLQEILKPSSSGSLEHDRNQTENNVNSVGEDAETQKQKDQIIDLTAALSCAKISNTNNFINKNKKSQRESFEIPFIDCDRRQQIPPKDNYCLMDISNTQFQHNLAEPSTLGIYLSSKTRRRPVKRLKGTFKAKHQVQRFLFDTKSPDDLVLASLNRFTRTQ